MQDKDYEKQNNTSDTTDSQDNISKEFYISEFYTSVFEIVDRCKEVGLVIYGAGFWGVQTLRIFDKLGIKALSAADDDENKQGKFLSEAGVLDNNTGDSIRIISLDTAASLYPDAVYISAATTLRDVRRTMNKKLGERGLQSKYSGFHPVRYMFFLDGALDALKNPATIKDNNFRAEYLNSIIVSNNMGNSGALYLNSLVDNHPNIVNIMTFFFAKYALFAAYENRLRYLEDEELIIETAAQCHQYLKWNDCKESLNAKRWQDRNLTVWYYNEKSQPELGIYIDGGQFIGWLSAELYGKGKVSLGYLIKAIYSAYNNTIGKPFYSGEKYWVFLDNHDRNFKVESVDPYIKDDFAEIEYWCIVREPVQHIFSLFKRYAHDDRFFKCSPGFKLAELHDYVSIKLPIDLGIPFQKNENNKNKIYRIIRFEDLKRDVEKYMLKVCKILDIPYDECMTETTFNGLQIYFPTIDRAGNPTIITGQDKTAVERQDFSKCMTSFDIFRLNLVTQDFKRNCGYKVDVPHYSEFSKEFLSELFKFPFKFEFTYRESFDKHMDSHNRQKCDPIKGHETIEGLFLSYMSKGPQEMFNDIITPDEELVEI